MTELAGDKIVNENTRLIDEADDDLFYFESDQLALQGNADYSEILKTIIILEAQKVKGIKNYEEIVRIQKEALNDPLAVVEKLKRGETLGLPLFQKVAELPKINYQKYNVTVPQKGIELLDKYVDETQFVTKEKQSSTHNQPWSVEEQKKLEELLLRFPPEAVEMNRFKKIAQALGNRTVQQVTSRVQKYFLKLYKHGLPIPGRLPKNIGKMYNKRGLKRVNKVYNRPTTFFPNTFIPVIMDENEDVPGPSTSKYVPTNFDMFQSSDSLPVSEDFMSESGKQKKIRLLEYVKKVKEKENASEELAKYRHVGYMCDFCNEDPITGSRWHCETCQQNSIDFCTDCVVSQIYSDKHNHASHKFSVIGPNKITSDTATPSTSTSNEDGSSKLSINRDFGDFDSDDSSSDMNSNRGFGGEDTNGSDDDDENFLNETQDDMFEYSNQDVEESIFKSGVYDDDYFIKDTHLSYLDPNYKVNE